MVIVMVNFDKRRPITSGKWHICVDRYYRDLHRVDAAAKHIMQSILEPLLKIAVLVAGLMTAAAYLVLVERWIAAWVQDRLGPNRVGIPLTKIRMFGLGQPIADGVKLLFKEQLTPSHVDRALFVVAPISIFVAAIAAFAVIPFGSAIPPEAFPASWGITKPISLEIAPNVDVGMIYIFAVGSIAVYGVVLGGWASNNKFSFLGGMRSSAQLISYELPLGLGILGVVAVTGSLRLDAIIARQAETGVWNVLTQPLGFVVFCVAGFAEAARLPFDLPEAEQELVGGYHTEYSGVKMMMYMVAEFLHMVIAVVPDRDPLPRRLALVGADRLGRRGRLDRWSCCG